MEDSPVDMDSCREALVTDQNDLNSLVDEELGVQENQDMDSSFGLLQRTVRIQHSYQIEVTDFMGDTSIQPTAAHPQPSTSSARLTTCQEMEVRKSNNKRSILAALLDFELKPIYSSTRIYSTIFQDGPVAMSAERIGNVVYIKPEYQYQPNESTDSIQCLGTPPSTVITLSDDEPENSEMFLQESAQMSKSPGLVYGMLDDSQPSDVSHTTTAQSQPTTPSAQPTTTQEFEV